MLTHTINKAVINFDMSNYGDKTLIATGLLETGGAERVGALNIAIEQMMRGRLVIASAIGGLGEVVGGAGIVCPPGDAEALAACMSAVIAHPERIAALGSKARERALGTFGFARMLEEHAEIYRRVASKRRVSNVFRS